MRSFRNARALGKRFFAPFFVALCAVTTHAIPPNGSLIPLSVSGEVSVDLSFNSLIGSQTNAHSTLEMGPSPTFIYLGRPTQMGVLPRVFQQDVAFAFQFRGTTQYPEQVPSTEPRFGGYNLRFHADFPFDGQGPFYFQQSGISTYHPGYPPSEIGLHQTIPAQALPFGTVAPIEFHFTGSTASPSDMQLGLFVSSIPSYANANYNIHGTVTASASITGTGLFQVSDNRVDIARRQAMDRIEFDENMFTFFRGIDAGVAVLTLGNAVKNFNILGRTTAELSADATEIAGATNTLNQWRTSGSDFFHLGNPGQDQTGFQAVQDELRSIADNPLNALDWAMGTRGLTFMLELGTPLDYRILADPPRFDYIELSAANRMALAPDVSALLSEDERLFIESHAYTLSLTNSIYVANERYQGALIDGNFAAAAAQSDLIFQNSLLLDQELPTTNALLTTLIGSYRTEMLASIQHLDMSTLARLAANPSWLDDLLAYDVFAATREETRELFEWFFDSIPLLSNEDVLFADYAIVSPYVTPAVARELGLDGPAPLGAVPEPTTYALMGCLLLLALCNRRLLGRPERKAV